jgi:hypothetical protein
MSELMTPRARARLSLAAVCAVAAAGVTFGAVAPASARTDAPAAARCPGPGVLTREAQHLYIARRELPDGSQWFAFGKVEFKLTCAIHSLELKVYLQRHNYLGTKHGIRRFEWVTYDSKDVDLAGQPAGHQFTVSLSHICTGEANWRIRMFGSPGRAQSGQGIAPEVVYYPDDAGREMNCRT